MEIKTIHCNREISLRKECLDIIDTMNDNGYECYLVGGCVRDILLDIEPQDYDFCTNARPEEITKLFERTIPTGVKYGTVTIVIGRNTYEMTTYRAESEYQDSRHPNSIEFLSSLKEDLMRRDFTINAIAYHPHEGFLSLEDSTGNDIKEGIICCVGDPKMRFMEDSIRILRALRFSLRYGFDIEDKTFRYMKLFAPLLLNISKERLYKELKEILDNEAFLTNLNEYLDILNPLFPFLNITELKKINYRFKKDTKLAEFYDSNRFLINLSLLLSNTDLTHVKNKEEENIVKFNLQCAVLDRLKLKKIERNRIESILRYMWLNHYEVDVNEELDNLQETLRQLRVILRITGYETAMCLLVLLEIMNSNSTGNYYMIADFLYMIQNASDRCVYIQDLCINGNDVKKYGYEGRKIKETLNDILNAIYEGKISNEKMSIYAWLEKNRPDNEY